MKPADEVRRNARAHGDQHRGEIANRRAVGNIAADGSGIAHLLVAKTPQQFVDMGMQGRRGQPAIGIAGAHHHRHDTGNLRAGHGHDWRVVCGDRHGAAASPPGAVWIGCGTGLTRNRACPIALCPWKMQAGHKTVQCRNLVSPFYAPPIRVTQGARWFSGLVRSGAFGRIDRPFGEMI